MRILFVGLPDSIHIAHWLNQLSGRGWDIHLFPATSVERFGLKAELRNTTVHNVLDGKRNGWHPSIRVEDDFWPFLGRSWPLWRGSNRARSLMRRWVATWNNLSWALTRTIRRLQPDIVHSLGIQISGYLTLEAKNHLECRFPPWVVSNWGSDIYLFGRLSEHREMIKAVLSACDYYLCECRRDIELGHAFGFRGEVLPLLPAAGGFDIEQIRQLKQPGPTSARRLIMLKGYQHWSGRALVGLRAIELCADLIKGYRVAIYVASSEVKIAAELLTHATGIPIDIVPPSSHEEILRLHGRARVSIGLGISDAISTSLLEAMTMGSFPIQSNTSCANEWVQCGETAILVPPEDPNAVAKALRRALSDDALVDRAAEINAGVTAERIDRSVVQPQVIAMYEKIFAETRAQTRRSEVTLQTQQ
jgi:hypothetical protein